MNINSKYLRKNIGYKGIRSFILSKIKPSIDNSNVENKEVDRAQNFSECTVKVKHEANDEITNIFSPLLGFSNIHIYVHGSWADNTKTPFSDLDDLIIIDEDKFSQKEFDSLKKALIKVEKKFQQLDPLQHHGHWIISKESLENYDASFMPLFILDDAVRVKGNKEIIYKKNNRKTREGLKKNIIITKNNIDRFFKQFRERTINIYNLKAFVGSVLLIPPMVFQYSRTEIDKRKAINNSSELFSPNAMTCIHWASTCRSEWSKITDSSSYTLFSYLLNFVTNPKYARKFAKKFSPGLSSQLYEEWELKESAIQNYLAEIDSYL